ncbi:MAG TPA: uracil-DNA glycosylase family protein [Acidimicrobiia bacterium]|nr:uracil-DNA glycosylase family protein [Acidimicrobiia bacterium]
MERDTVRVYQERAAEWRETRPARFLDQVHTLAAAVPTGAPVVDLGCGAGLHLPHLPRPRIALDAAHAMLLLARETAPDAWPVQADLEALPFRRGALGGGWARASYLHVRRERLPRALAELHQALEVGAPAHLLMLAGDESGELPDDDFAGRWFAAWRPDALHDVLVGAGFDVHDCSTEAESQWIHARITRARTLPDTVGLRLRLLVCGLNPSLHAADAGVGFVTPGNRFWPAAIAAGLVTVDRDPRAALDAGIGMTDLAKRATSRADELTRDEYRGGLARVERLVRWLQPGAVCFVGLAGWRAAVDRRAVAGVQPAGLGGRPVYVMPSTSGLNARVPPAELTDHLRAAAELSDRFGAAGVP